MGVKIEKLNSFKKNPNLLVKVTEMGNVIENQYMSHRNQKATIQMLKGGNEYVELSTGEIKEIKHHETRATQYKSLCRTFRNVRALINTNVTDVNNVHWITLTYKENMTDTKRLYDDFKKFNMRYQYYIKQKGFDKAEYIVMCEPQGRGAWHCHLLYIYDCKAPFVPNKDLASIWGHGFVKIKKLDDVDNVGVYLTAYLGDMEVKDLENLESLNKSFEMFGEGKVGDGVKDIEIMEGGKLIKKRYIKGARLPLYPANFNMYRCSRGIKKPSVEMMSQFQANKKVSDATKTFEKTVKLTDIDNDFECVINTVHYNKISNKKQEGMLK